MGIIQKLELQAKKRTRDWAILRLAGYKLEPMYKKWYQGDFSKSSYIRFDGNLRSWCWSGNNAHEHVCNALNQRYKPDDD